MTDKPNIQQAWPRGWEAHEKAQLKRLARMSMAEKLKWLEEAHRLVLHLNRQDSPTLPNK